MEEELNQYIIKLRERGVCGSFLIIKVEVMKILREQYEKTLKNYNLEHQMVGLKTLIDGKSFLVDE